MSSVKTNLCAVGTVEVEEVDDGSGCMQRPGKNCIRARGGFVRRSLLFDLPSGRATTRKMTTRSVTDKF